MVGSPSNSRVAVIVPVYNPSFLADALESVFCQSRQPDEIIVIDDGAPDQEGLERAVAPYADRLTLLRQANQGAAAARNRGIAATSAGFIALLDADDRWLPDFLHQQLSIFDAQPSIDLTFTDGLIIGRTALAGRTFAAACQSEGQITFERLLSQQCTILLSSVVARRAAVVEAGGFDVTLRRGQDFDLWLRMARRGARMTYQPEVLVLRRIHQHNLSGTAVTEAERPLRVLEKALRTMALSPAERRLAEVRIQRLTAALEREQGKEYLRRGDFRAARRAFAQARKGITSWKLQATFFALHFAPSLVRRFYMTRTADAMG
jgi:glycosyltransferase involved in cell wall biosynthesis